MSWEGEVPILIVACNVYEIRDSLVNLIGSIIGSILCTLKLLTDQQLYLLQHGQG